MRVGLIEPMAFVDAGLGSYALNDLANQNCVESISWFMYVLVRNIFRDNTSAIVSDAGQKFV
jgi:hypothetical protein